MRWPYNGGILQKRMAYAIICCNSSTSFGSFQYCKLIGLFWKLTRRQLWTLTCPIENCKIILAPKIQRQDNLSVLRQLYHSAKLSDCDLNHSSTHCEHFEFQFFYSSLWKLGCWATMTASRKFKHEWSYCKP